MKGPKTYERGSDISALGVKSENFLPSSISESNPRTSLMPVFGKMSHHLVIFSTIFVVQRDGVILEWTCLLGSHMHVSQERLLH